MKGRGIEVNEKRANRLATKKAAAWTSTRWREREAKRQDQNGTGEGEAEAKRKEASSLARKRKKERKVSNQLDRTRLQAIKEGKTNG